MFRSNLPNTQNKYPKEGEVGNPHLLHHRLLTSECYQFTLLIKYSGGAWKGFLDSTSSKVVGLL